MDSAATWPWRPVVVIILLATLVVGPLPLCAGKKSHLVVGLTDRFLLAPAFDYIYGTAANQIEVREFAASAKLREAFTAGDIDMIVDSQQSLALLPPSTLQKTLVVWDVASSYGNIAIVSATESGGPKSASRIDGTQIALESATPAHYFSIWLRDVMSFDAGGPKLLFRREPYITRAMKDKTFSAAVIEEPSVSAILQQVSDARVISSTAAYQPIVHYLAAIKDSSIRSCGADIALLMEAFYAGAERAVSWENLLLNTGMSCGMTAGDVLVRLKYLFFDRAYNTEEFFGLGLGQRIMAAATSTWEQPRLIYAPSAKAETAQSVIKFSNELISDIQSKGKTLRPLRPPWSDTEMEILVEQTEIGFSLNSAVIPEAGHTTLTSIVHKINTVCGESYRIRVEGYADSLGSPAHNLGLSQRRAKAVAEFLRSSLDLPTEDVEWVGHGVGGDDPSYRKTVITVLQKVVSTQ